jgi:hypothetical protein
MLGTHKIFEHLFIIMLGFATYETVYFNKETSNVLDSAYFYTVSPILFCTVFSVLCSTWAASAFRNRLAIDKAVESEKSKKFERNASFFIVVSIYFEFRVFFMTFNDINQRTALCFAIAFFLAKIAMYAEAHELLKKAPK